METHGTRQKQPLVSVVIPAHNEEKWIAACLESVLETDGYPNKEVVVVDDASTDSTSQILERFPVTAIRNEKPAGPSSARNIGVREARGEVIVFIDAHCIIDDPEWIQKYLQLFCDPHVGAVGGYFRRETSKWGPSLSIRPSESRLRLVKSANGAYRRAVFEQVGGFDSGMEWGGDAALTFKVDESGWKAVHSRDIKVVHAEKIWPVKKVFLYGTCYCALRKKYPRYNPVRGLLISPMVMGPIVTLGAIADLLFRLPVFALSLVMLLSILNGVAGKGYGLRILVDGFYTAVWCLSYYLGAVYGAARDALLNGVGYFRRLWIRAQNLDEDRLAS